MKNEIIVDPHYLSGEKEKWHLKFNHSSCLGSGQVPREAFLDTNG